MMTSLSNSNLPLRDEKTKLSLMIPLLCTFIAYNVVIGSRSCFCYWSWSTSCSVYPLNILIHFLLFLIFKIATAQPHDYVLQQPCVTPKIYIHTYIPISQCVHIYVFYTKLIVYSCYKDVVKLFGQM